MTTVPVNTEVKTPYGVGVVTAISEESGLHTIRLTSWVLSNNACVYVHSLPSAFEVVKQEETKVEEETKTEEVKVDAAAAVVVEETKVEEEAKTEAEDKPEVEETKAEDEAKSDTIAVGTAVSTQYGEGKVQSYDTDRQIYHIELTSWVLSGESRVHVYCGVESLKVVAEEKTTESKPEEEETKAAEPAAAAAATTTEVAAVVESEVAVEDEANAAAIAVGSPVFTQYGTGKVMKCREDGIYEIELTSWVLSGESRVHVFCTADNLIIDNKGEIAQGKTKPTDPKTGGCCVIM